MIENYKYANQYTLALECFNECIKRDPSYTAAIVNLANLKVIINDYEDAIKLYNEVLNSKWAKILGIPISFPGMLFYGIILILSLNNSSSKNFLSRKIILIAIFLAVVASVYLTYIEIFIIKAICQYCVGSAILILINSITIISIYKKENLFKSFRIWQVLLLEDEAKASPNPQTQK